VSLCQLRLKSELKLNLDPKGMTRGAFKELAPGLFRGFIVEIVKPKTALEVAEFLETATIWDWVPDAQKNFLISLRPWPLEWLDTKWILESITNGNKAAGYLLIASPNLQDRIAESVKDIKERLE